MEASSFHIFASGRRLIIFPIFIQSGCAHAGIIVALLNPVLSDRSLKRQITQARVKAMFTFPPMAKRAQALANDSPCVKELILYGEEEDDTQ